MRKFSLALVFLALISGVSASSSSGEWTGDNATDSFEISIDTENVSASVNDFGTVIGNVSAKYQDNMTTGSRTFDVELTGNATSFLDAPKQFTLFGNETSSFPVVANIPAVQKPGFYQLNLSMTGRKNSNFTGYTGINVSVADDINPVVESLSVDSVQATESVEWRASVTDNLNISSVTGSVYRVETVTVNNTTQQNNVSIGEGVKFESLGRGLDTFTYTFTETSQIGDYYLVLNASDSSGNSVVERKSFQVNGLDSITVLNGDFSFKDSRPRTEDSPKRQVEKKVFSKKAGEDLGLELSDFGSLTGNNTSLTIGVRYEDSANIQELYQDEEFYSVTVDQPGDYYLVAFSEDSGFSYDGTLMLSPVDQHVSFDRSIEFNGAFVDPDYPELPEDRSIGSFDGSMSFVLNENGVPTGIRFEGVQNDIDDCQNAESWSNCIPGFSLGEIPEVKQENTDLESANKWLRTQRNLAFMFLAVFVFITLGNNYGKGTMETEKKVRDSHIGQIVEKPEDIELGRA